MTFWDFCHHHYVLVGFSVFTLGPLFFLLVYDVAVLAHNAHRNAVIARLNGRAASK